MDHILTFVDQAAKGFPDAAAYRLARRAVIDEACGGDELAFFAAWNKLVADGSLPPLLHAPIGTVQKPTVGVQWRSFHART